jgi:hypothetical protein
VISCEEDRHVTPLPRLQPHRIREMAPKGLRNRHLGHLNTRPTTTLFYEAILKSSTQILQLLRVASAVTLSIRMRATHNSRFSRTRSAPISSTNSVSQSFTSGSRMFCTAATRGSTMLGSHNHPVSGHWVPWRLISSRRLHRQHSLELMAVMILTRDLLVTGIRAELNHVVPVQRLVRGADSIPARSRARKNLATTCDRLSDLAELESCMTVPCIRQQVPFGHLLADSNSIQKQPCVFASVQGCGEIERRRQSNMSRSGKPVA